MPTKKAVKRKSAKPATKRRSTTKKPKHEFGSYTTTRGTMTLQVPPFWTMRQTNEDLEIHAPSGKTAVYVTSYIGNGTSHKHDAREYLKTFLHNAQIAGRARIEETGRMRAEARYKDPDGDNWILSFLTNGKRMLLATCNTSLPTKHEEASSGVRVIQSIAFGKSR